MAYLDTSVVAAYYCPEEISDKAERYILGDNEPVISTLVSVELASALSRKIREKTMSEPDARKVWGQFNHHRLDGYYTEKPVEASHYNQATEWILQFKTTLRTLDALHLAVAYEASLPILTADHQLARTAEKLGIKYLLI